MRDRLIHAGYPGASDDSVASSIAQAVHEAGVNAIVCLQPEAELLPLPPYLGRLSVTQLLNDSCALDPISWIHHPIPDGGIAIDGELKSLILCMLERLERGERLLVHCLGGHGRSGVVSACLVGTLLGLSGEQALEFVQASHHMREDPWASRHRSPETAQQRAQVERLLMQLQIPAGRAPGVVTP